MQYTLMYFAVDEAQFCQTEYICDISLYLGYMTVRRGENRYLGLVST